MRNGNDSLIIYDYSPDGILGTLLFFDNIQYCQFRGPGPEFYGSLSGWVNKINHLGRRIWIDPESGISYYISDAGEIIRLHVYLQFWQTRPGLFSSLF